MFSMKKKEYTAPSVIKIHLLSRPVTDLLAGSIVDDTAIRTTGQEIDGYYDGDGSSFNHEWM